MLIKRTVPILLLSSYNAHTNNPNTGMCVTVGGMCYTQTHTQTLNQTQTTKYFLFFAFLTSPSRSSLSCLDPHRDQAVSMIAGRGGHHTSHIYSQHRISFFLTASPFSGWRRCNRKTTANPLRSQSFPKAQTHSGAGLREVAHFSKAFSCLLFPPDFPIHTRVVTWRNLKYLDEKYLYWSIRTITW